MRERHPERALEISIHALREERDREYDALQYATVIISIHALREERDWSLWHKS